MKNKKNTTPVRVGHCDHSVGRVWLGISADAVNIKLVWSQPDFGSNWLYHLNHIINLKVSIKLMRSLKIRITLGTSLEKAMAPHSSTLAWKIPWMEEPSRLQSMGSLRVRHD